MIRLRLASVGPRAVLQALPFRDASGRRLTVAAKVTLELVGREPFVPAAPARTSSSAAFPALLDPESAEAAPAPLPLAQFVVTGHARLPNGRAEAAAHARVRLLRGALTLVDKTVLVYGDRDDGAGAPRPFTEMPLEHERASGSAWNPVGRMMARGDAPPNLVPDHPSRPIACFASIPAPWPSRAQLLGGAAAPASVEPTLPPGFDTRYYLDAPQDQWVSDLVPGDVLELGGMSATFASMVAEIPAWDVTAAIRVDGREPRELALVAACLAVDADRRVFSVTWRGTTPFTLHETEGAAVDVSIVPRAPTASVTSAPPMLQAPPPPPLFGERTPARTAPVPSIEDTFDGSLHERQPTLPFAAAVPGIVATGPSAGPTLAAWPFVEPRPPATALAGAFDDTGTADGVVTSPRGELIAPPARLIAMADAPAIAVAAPRAQAHEETGTLSIPSGEVAPAPPACSPRSSRRPRQSPRASPRTRRSFSQARSPATPCAPRTSRAPSSSRRTCRGGTCAACGSPARGSNEPT